MSTPIYNSNAGKIGLLGDEALIRAIVQCHVHAQGLWEVLVANSALLQLILSRMSEATAEGLEEALTDSPVERQLLIAKRNALVAQALSFERTYRELESRMATALGQAAEP
jgi:hypothetical protein